MVVAAAAAVVAATAVAGTAYSASRNSGNNGITGTTTSQSTEQDAITQALNQYRLQQLQSIPNSDFFLNNTLRYGNLSPQTQDITQLGLGQSTVPGLDPSQWYNNTYNNLTPNSQQQDISNLAGQNLNFLGQGTSQFSNALSTTPLAQYLQNYSSGLSDQIGNITQNNLDTTNAGFQNAYGDIGGLGQSNLNYINGPLANRLLGSGQDYFRQILSPQIQNQSALLGLARSGYNEEAQAKGAASISLPISQLIAQLGAGANQQTQGLQAQNLSNLSQQTQGQLLTNLGAQQNIGLGNLGAQQSTGLTGLGFQSNLYGQNLGLSNQNLLANLGAQQGYGTQYLQNLYGLNQQQPNVDIALRNAALSRLGSGLQFSDYERQAGASQNQQALSQFLAMFNGTPYNPSPTITGTQNSGLLTGLGGSGLSTLAASASAGKSLGLFGNSFNPSQGPQITDPFANPNATDVFGTYLPYGG